MSEDEIVTFLREQIAAQLGPAQPAG
jgi:hypothetical protein